MFEQKMLAGIDQNLAILVTKVHACAEIYTHVHTHWTRFGSLGDLGQCFLPPFANVITAVQPFLSAWTTEMSGA